ncbi:MAG: Uma2 family endonuclease [Planctomycetota bacterium]
MTAAESIPLVSVEDYLAAELDGEVRHEYLGGYVYRREDSTNRHARLTTALIGILHPQVTRVGFEPFTVGQLLKIGTGGQTLFYYPDGMVIPTPDAIDEHYQEKPVVIAEVLSESTRRADEGEKREAYLSAPTLKVYLLIETDKPEVRVYRRAGDDFTTELHRGPNAVVPLNEIEAELPLSELYARVRFSEPRSE